jgi:sugar lactone lactonase YvrE
MADPLGGRVLRVDATGTTTDVLDVGVPVAFACVLGGADRRTLFACVGVERAKLNWSGVGANSIITTRVAIPGAGVP